MALSPLRLFSCGLLCTLISCGGSSDDSDDQTPSQNACSIIGLSNERIIDGSECGDGRSPVVMLDFGSSACSGTLLTSRHIVTAAHCFLTPVASVDIRLGNGQPSLARGSSVTVHPNFGLNEDQTILVNDVAVVELDQDMALPTLPVVTSTSVESDQIISIFGYGQTEMVPNGQGGASGGNLHSGQMTVAEVTNEVVIAEFGEEGSNTCFGDSGGPATLTYTKADGTLHTGLVGITSGGSSQACEKGELSSFTNVQSEPVLSFIREAVPGLREE